jgi:hypothetical protein
VKTPAEINPWYREPWPWLLMAGPALVVAAGAATLWLAMASNDGLVADDYYKRGLAINQSLQRDLAARAGGYQAHLLADAGRVRVTLSGEGTPAALRLTLAHPTRAGLDRTVRLAPRAGGYEGEVGALAPGSWHAALEDEGGNWRLHGVWRVPQQHALRLEAR